MGPGRNRYWLPLVRLSAFFAAVVVAGNLFLHAVHAPPEAAPGSRPEDERHSRKRRKFERYLRTIERFLDGGGAGRSSGRTLPPLPAPPTASLLEPVAEPLATGEPEGVEQEQAAAAPGPGDVRILSVADPEPPAFAWPLPPPEPPTREIDLPRVAREIHLQVLTPALLAELEEAWAADPAADVGDVVLKLPELVFDSLFTLGALLFPRAGSHVWGPGDSESITGRIFDIGLEPRQGRIFSNFTANFVEREMRFFARFGDSHLYTFGFEDGTAEIDSGDLADEQRKVFWDALKKTYLSKYQFKAEDRIRDDAFFFNEWRGVDFAALPPLIAGYLYYRGVDKRFSVAGTSVRLSVEAGEKWLDGDDDLLGGAGLEWSLKRFPVGIIVTAGLYDGRAELDFVGIGTSIGMVRKALHLQHDDPGN